MKASPVDLRLAVPAAVAWIATVVLIGSPNAALPALVGAWVLAGLAAAVAITHRRAAVVALAAAAVALCCTSVAVQSPGRQPVLLDTHATISAIGVTTQTIDPGRGPFAVTLSRVECGRPCSRMIRCSCSVGRSRVGIGATVELHGTVVPAEPGDDVAFLLPDRAADCPRATTVSPGLGLRFGRFRRGHLAASGDGGDLLAGRDQRHELGG